MQVTMTHDLSNLHAMKGIGLSVLVGKKMLMDWLYDRNDGSFRRRARRQVLTLERTETEMKKEEKNIQEIIT